MHIIHFHDSISIIFRRVKKVKHLMFGQRTKGKLSHPQAQRHRDIPPNPRRVVSRFQAPPAGPKIGIGVVLRVQAPPPGPKTHVGDYQ